jgi:predicted dehydrogenase
MIKIAVIGFGKIGQVRAREINANPHTVLVGIYDKYPEQLESCTDNSVIKCMSVEEVLSLDIDAVFVCTYNKYAPEYTMLALQKGKHVFCEKPPARNSQELEEVIEIEKKTGLVLKYGFNHRYHYSVMEAKKLIEKNFFGKLLWLRGVYGKAGGNKFESNWRNNYEESGGGILLDQGIHMLDLMILFAGEFVEVKSMVQTKYWNVSVEDNAFALMKTNNNVTAMLHSSATQWRHKFVLEMNFEDGTIILDGILSSTRSYGDETLIVSKRQFEDEAFAFGKPREEKIYFDTDDSWKLELEEFVDVIQNNKKVEQGSSFDAITVMRTIEKIYEESKYYNQDGE